jgi:hypothetical protein
LRNLDIGKAGSRGQENRFQGPGAGKTGSRFQGSGVRKKRENMSLTENTEAQSLGKYLKTEDRESRFQGSGFRVQEKT